MIKAAGSNPLGVMDKVFLGISQGNWDKLLEGKPIMIKLQKDLHPQLPDITVVLLGGETEDDLMQDLAVVAPTRPNPYDTEAEEQR